MSDAGMSEVTRILILTTGAFIAGRLSHLCKPQGAKEVFWDPIQGCGLLTNLSIA